MEQSLKTGLSDYLLAIADDELLIGQRNAEWCGHAPILEEDIAFANLALDEIGHAATYYAIYAVLNGEDADQYPDELVYFRQPGAFRNSHMVELPNGDWAFSMLRQYLFDAWEKVHLEALTESSFAPLSEVSRKLQVEEYYHFRHSSAWIKRLGLGTEESNRRCQSALDQLWPLANNLIASLPQYRPAIEAGLIPETSQRRQGWTKRVAPFLEESGLAIPTNDGVMEDLPGREQHSQHLIPLLSEMQSVARLEPGAMW